MRNTTKLPAADARLVKLETTYRRLSGELATIRAEIDRRERVAFGGEIGESSRAWSCAAWGVEAEAERLAEMAKGAPNASNLNRMSAEFAQVSRAARKLQHDALRSRRERERKAGLVPLRKRERGMSIMFGRLHDKIMSAKPAGWVGAAVQLRHLLDVDLGIASGVCGYDIPALTRILGMVERLAPSARAIPGKPRPLATAADA